MSTEIKYWKRAEPDGNTVFFATATNAGHDRAEKDERASQITEEEYRANVPKDADLKTDTPKRAEQAKPQQEEQTQFIPDDLIAKNEAWDALQQWTFQFKDRIAIQDMIAMLELWKYQLCGHATSAMAESMQQQIEAHQRAAANVN